MPIGCKLIALLSVYLILLIIFFQTKLKNFWLDAERTIETAVGKRISVLTPLINFSKTDILAMANERGIDQTYSCHSGTEEPCGICIACLEINNAKGEK